MKIPSWLQRCLTFHWQGVVQAFVLASLLSGLVWSIWHWSSLVALWSDYWRLKQVEVVAVTTDGVTSDSGFRYLQVSDVTDVTWHEQNFWSVDLMAIQAQVQQVNWVNQVEAQRIWPDTLRLLVVEDQAVARWCGKGLVGQSGKVFYPVVDEISQVDVALPWQDLATLCVKNAPVDVPLTPVSRLVRQYQHIEAKLVVLQRFAVALIQHSPQKMVLHLDNKQQVILDEAHWERQIQRFVLAYNDPVLVGESNRKGMSKADLQLRLRQAKRFDMRYTNGFSIQPQSQSD